MSNKPPNDITIRAAVDEDSEQILTLIFDIWINEYHFDVKQEDFPDLHAIEKYYSDVGGVFLVAAIQDVVIGTIGCDRLNDENFVLKRMFVNKNYRGMGIAQMLLEQLFQQVVFSKSHQNISFYLSTKESDAIAAKAFYLKNGFRVIPKPDLPKGFPFFYQDDLFMVRSLKCSQH